MKYLWFCFNFTVFPFWKSCQDSVHLVQYNLLNMCILFQYIPCHNTNITLDGLDLPQNVWHGFVENQLTFWNNAVQVVVYVLTSSISISLPYFKAVMFGLRNVIPEFFLSMTKCLLHPSSFSIFFSFLLLPYVPLKLLWYLSFIKTIAHCITDLWCIVQFV